MSDSREESIRSFSRPCCYLCSSAGQLLYKGLRDRLSDTPGEWNIRKCPNRECGLIWPDPTPLPEDLGRAYENYYTHQEGKNPPLTWPRRLYRWAGEGYLAGKYGYHSQSTAVLKRLFGKMLYFYPGRRENLDFSVMYLPRHPGGRLLDVGCGSGHKLKFLQDLGWQAQGVDLDPVAVESARAKGMRVRQGFLEEQGYPEEYFDAVTMSHLIEHVYDPLGLLVECRRILKPGGRLVVVTPNGGSWMHGIFGSNWLALDPPRHLHIFTPSSFKLLMGKAGFRRFSLSTTIREANGLFLASKSIERTGSYLWGSPQPRSRRLAARGMQFVEWALLKVRPDSGEEIAMVGEK